MFCVDKEIKIAYNSFIISQTDEDCQFCLEKVGIGLGHMNGDAVPKIIDLLNAEICPTMEWDVEECKVGVSTWWPKISEKIFDPVAAQYVCGPDFIANCPAPTSK